MQLEIHKNTFQFLETLCLYLFVLFLIWISLHENDFKEIHICITRVHTKCVESPYPMANSTHGIRIELEMHNFVAKLLFCVVNLYQKGL